MITSLSKDSGIGILKKKDASPESLIHNYHTTSFRGRNSSFNFSKNFTGIISTGFEGTDH